MRGQNALHECMKPSKNKLDKGLKRKENESNMYVTFHYKVQNRYASPLQRDQERAHKSKENLQMNKNVVVSLA